jgi:hypothetical protein
VSKSEFGSSQGFQGGAVFQKEEDYSKGSKPVVKIEMKTHQPDTIEERKSENVTMRAGQSVN